MRHKHIYDDYGICFECDQGKPKINDEQLDLLLAKLIKGPEQRKAVRIYMKEGVSAYEAEKRVFGRITCGVSRDAKRVNEAFNFAVLLLGLQGSKGK